MSDNNLKLEQHELDTLSDLVDERLKQVEDDDLEDEAAVLRRINNKLAAAMG